MAGTTPKYAFPYPDGTDPLSDGDNKIRALAERVEAVLTGMEGYLTTDCNTATTPGFWYSNPGVAHGPEDGVYLAGMTMRRSAVFSGGGAQLAVEVDVAGRTWVRGYSGAAWGTWKRVTTTSTPSTRPVDPDQDDPDQDDPDDPG